MELPPISVLLPVHRAPDTLGRAIESVTSQTTPEGAPLEVEVVLVLNGSDAATTRVAESWAGADPRFRLIERVRADLPSALNAGLEASSYELVARMDADDACHPHRLALQAGHMMEHPKLAALGCAWSLVEAGEGTTATVRPPTDPRAARWRLLLANEFAHGSMMLRRSGVLEAGGYDETMARAQDHDLWLRLSERAGVCAIDDVLYTYFRPPTAQGYASSEVQARHEAELLLEHWRRLDPAGANERVLRDRMTEVLCTANGHASLESLLTEIGPSREGLLARLWADFVRPSEPREAIEAGRRALLRETGARLREHGIVSVHLYGAGAHTRWVLDHLDDLGLAIDGIIDDALAGERRLGFEIIARGGVEHDACVLLSSDSCERELWDRSSDLRARGVRVEPIYGAYGVREGVRAA